MFTGLIEDVGEVTALHRGERTRLVVRTGRIPPAELVLGESVAVDGCCLTVVAVEAGGFVAEVSPESLARTTLGEARPGTRVNLERAMRLGDRLGGHLVLGHVDGVGRIERRARVGDFVELTVEAPPEVARWLLPKGSVALDGISLTVNEVRDRRFTLMVIPETQQRTGLVGKGEGARVNLEGDVLGKWVARLVGTAGGAPAGGVDEEFLRRHGFA
jgi:riboflavin synthase